jgi:carboxylesterase
MSSRSGGLTGEGDPSPIRIPGRAPAVLALHGFGGTPLEIELVVDVARELGLAAYAPLLPGHGTHVSDLANTRFSDWERAAERAFDELGQKPVIVAGLSMGSLLAARLAARRSDQTLGLLMLANALWLTAPFPAWALSAIGALKIRDFCVPKPAADIADPVARRTHLTYSAQPVHAAIDLQRAAVGVRADLARVRCPTLIAHGARDRVCPVSNAARALDLIGGGDKRVVVLPRSRHIITRDVERVQLRHEVRGFLDGITNRVSDSRKSTGCVF